jgi:hypothetical protein
MMLEATNFLRKWCFSVSAKKTQVVACGKNETQGLKNRTWEIGGKVARDVSSYKYLGLHFGKDGLWTAMRKANIKSAQNSYGALYKIDFAEARLQIGQSAFLWNLFAKPLLLYGAETWSGSSKKVWQDLESAPLQGARRTLERRPITQRSERPSVETLVGFLLSRKLHSQNSHSMDTYVVHPIPAF